jgi:hypothetical protein
MSDAFPWTPLPTGATLPVGQPCCYPTIRRDAYLAKHLT